DWVKKYNLEDSDIVISDKLDGVSTMLVYNNGAFSIAYSRGDGINGADITRHVKHVNGLVENVSSDYLVIRCELEMKNDVFNEKYADKYKNPRNMVAGAFNRKETDK